MAVRQPIHALGKRPQTMRTKGLLFDTWSDVCTLRMIHCVYMSKMTFLRCEMKSSRLEARLIPDGI